MRFALYLIGVALRPSKTRRPSRTAPPQEGAQKQPTGAAVDPKELRRYPVLCSNPDIKGAREWLIDAIARRALEILGQDGSDDGKTQKTEAKTPASKK